jgi:tetratricopeptide (TPR) repeat protein
LYEQAVVIDPEFARAWAAMALATANMMAYTTIPAEELMLKAQGYAFRALALDPNQSEAIMVLPVLMAYERRWEQVLKNLDRAIELDPSNTTARIWKSESLWRLGYLKEAYREIEIAVTLDPSSPPANYDQAYYALRMGDLNKATELAESITTVAFRNASYLQALLAIENNDLARATELLPKAFAVLGVSEEDGALIASGLSNPQKRSAGIKILDNVSNQIVDKRVSKFNVDIVLEMYKQYGAQDKAMELSNRLVEDGTAFIDYSFWGLQNLSIRQHPAFRKTVQKRGLLEYWYLHGWPDECNTRGNTLICN